MFRRTVLAALLVGTVGLPYLVSKSSSLRDAVFQSAGEPTHATPPVEHPLAAAAIGGGGHPPAAIEGVRVTELADVFRFEITTAWVLGHWPRVSTGLAELGLQGYRVPLVTGTRDADVAGALTYYFNSQQVVERITFQGTTGDARKLVGVLVSNHGFVREMTGDPGLFLYRVVDGKGEVRSELRIRPKQVVRAEDPRARFDVTLKMARP